MKKLTPEDIAREQIEKSTYNYLSEALSFCLDNVDAYKWDSKTTKQAFEYYNYFHRANETAYFCSSCRAKVNKGLRKFITIIPEYLSELITDDLKEVCGESYGILSIAKIRSLMGL